MKPLLEKYGLSARRKTIDKIKKTISRFRAFWTLLLLSVFLLSSCHERSNGQQTADLKDHPSAAKDTADKPKVNIKVNRHYDDKGNLIGFDSTYSSFYSNFKGDTSQMDSLMHSFDKYFNRNHSSLFDRQFNNLFLHDSLRLRYPDFFHDDFFMKRYELNDAYLRGMMHRMDSIKNQFYEEHSKRKQSNDL